MCFFRPLLFGEKQGKPPKQARIFPSVEPLKSMGKKGKNAQKARTFLATKKARKWRRPRFLPTFFLPSWNAKAAYFGHFGAKKGKGKEQQGWPKLVVLLLVEKCTFFPSFEQNICLKGRQKTRPWPRKSKKARKGRSGLVSLAKGLPFRVRWRRSPPRDPWRMRGAAGTRQYRTSLGRGTKYPLTQNYYLRKIILKYLFLQKLRISRVIPWKSLSFLEIWRAQNPSKITKNNSQGIIFAIISCQRVLEKGVSCGGSLKCCWPDLGSALRRVVPIPPNQPKLHFSHGPPPPPVHAWNGCHLSNWRSHLETVHILGPKWVDFRPFRTTFSMIAAQIVVFIVISSFPPF